jgi:diacylglycerol kinase family enzyme
MLETHVTQAAADTVPRGAASRADLQPMSSPLRVHAVVNLNAGTALSLTESAIRDAVATAFTKAGHEISMQFLPPSEIESAIERAARSDADVIIVGGGDGTVRTAARHLLGKNKALGILPLGTMNRLAKDLEVPLNLAEAAEFLATARPSTIDAARVNGKLFLCNSLMGISLQYSVARARLRGKPAISRFPRYIAIIREMLASRRKISVVVDSGTQALRLRAMSIVVTNNGYDEATPWLQRPRLDGGKLTVYISQHRSGLGMAKAVVFALLGRWRGDPNVTKLTGAKIVIRSPRRRKRLSNDGEVEKMSTPLTYEILPRALTVLTRDGGSPS